MFLPASCVSWMHACLNPSQPLPPNQHPGIVWLTTCLVCMHLKQLVSPYVLSPDASSVHCCFVYIWSCMSWILLNLLKHDDANVLLLWAGQVSGIMSIIGHQPASHPRQWQDQQAKRLEPNFAILSSLSYRLSPPASQHRRLSAAHPPPPDVGTTAQKPVCLPNGFNMSDDYFLGMKSDCGL